MKEGKLLKAKQVFEKSGVSITVEGKKHLGAAIGTNTFIENYVTNKVSGWVSETERLSQIAESQPHAAYAALTHGLSSKWTYLARTMPDIDLLLEPLEAAIRLKFVPALTGQSACNDLERELLALPIRLGGLGIAFPSSRAKSHNSASRKITGPHKDLILQQSHEFPAETKNTQIRIKNQLRTERRRHHKTSATSLAEKWRAYDERIWEVEHGSFSPLVFSSAGGMGPTSTVVYKRLATLIAKKKNKPYSRTIHWLRCRLSFSLLRSAILCLRGSCSSAHHPASPANLDLVCSEGRVPRDD